MRRRHSGISYKDFTVLLFLAVLIGGFTLLFCKNFWENCIWELPSHWDIATCWHEQEEPSWNKATEWAINFLPEGKWYRKH